MHCLLKENVKHHYVNSKNMLNYGQDPHANVTFANIFEICKTKAQLNDPQNNSASRTYKL